MGSQRRHAVSRRSQSGFSQLNRRVETGLLLPRRANARSSMARPRDEPGVLWDAFREHQESAG
jgi:hypothetical protein